jgi:hypothetical protein
VADNPNQRKREEFLFPIGKYYGEFSPAKLAFNANLQEFAQRVSLLCALETGGKISPEETYEQIKQLWAQLEHSKLLLLDQESPSDPG